MTVASAWCRAASAVSRSAWGCGMLGDQFLLAIRGQLRQFQSRLGIREIAFALVNDRRIRRRIDLRDNLPGLDLGIKIRVELKDIAGNLAAHLDVDHGIERSGGRHDLGDVSTSDGSGLILDRIGMRVFEVPPTHRRQRREAPEP